jgi:hypothetical protein
MAIVTASRSSRLLRAARRCGASLLGLALVAAGLHGCQSSGAARSPKEIQDYRNEVLQDHEAELTAEQKNFVLLSTAQSRSYADIDRALQQAQEKFPRAEAAKARAAESGIEIGARRKPGRIEWVETRPGTWKPVRSPASVVPALPTATPGTAGAD